MILRLSDLDIDIDIDLEGSSSSIQHKQIKDRRIYSHDKHFAQTIAHLLIKKDTKVTCSQRDIFVCSLLKK